jgi:7-cyano-7-deazaguanine synthase in queuosine biosynthesis
MTFRACKAFYELHSFNYEAKYNKEHEIVKQLEAQLGIYQRDIRNLEASKEQTITKDEPEVNNAAYDEMIKQWTLWPEEYKEEKRKEAESK